MLFVPLITPTVDRSHLMADDAPFLFPIVLGDVTDATARVPDKFGEVQWTRLRLDPPAVAVPSAAVALKEVAGVKRRTDARRAAGVGDVA